MDYRVLALDGGGTWALIQVKALMQLYSPNTTGHAVLQDFDLVAANSGGSIVLGALLENLPLNRILQLFEDEATRRTIFSKTDHVIDRVLHDLTGFGPKYSAANKLPALERVLSSAGGTSLPKVVSGIRRPGAQTDLSILIVAFDYDRNRARFFRSSASGGASWGSGDAAEVTLAEAIDASTNAPVDYFDAPAMFPEPPSDQMGRYWDGAIAGCNNPILAGVTEAITKQVNPVDIRALSIGTASVARPWRQPDDPESPYFQPLAQSSLKTDLGKLATSILDDPPDAATFLAHVMTGGKEGLNKPPADSRIVRMNPLISPIKSSGAWGPPPTMTEKDFNFLVNLDMDAVKQSQVNAISGYADLWLDDLAPNQPIRMDGDTLTTELGQDRFSGALAAWKALTQQAAAATV